MEGMGWECGGDLLPAQLQQLSHCAAEARNVLKQVQCCGGSLLASQAPDTDYFSSSSFAAAAVVVFLFCCCCFSRFFFSLWGVYSNNMHPSIITMHTFTH